MQGPFEASWGYLCPTVCDWNGDGLPDVVVPGSRAKFEVMLNRGTREKPELDAPVALSVDNLELYGTWRVRPAIARIGGSNRIVIMDKDNALHMYRQIDDFNVEDMGKLRLTDGSQITGHNNAMESLGQMGRGKLRFVDWDGDGKLDLLIGSVKRSSYPSPERGLPYSRFKKKEIGLQVMLLINAGTMKRWSSRSPSSCRSTARTSTSAPLFERPPNPVCWATRRRVRIWWSDAKAANISSSNTTGSRPSASTTDTVPINGKKGPPPRG